MQLGNPIFVESVSAVTASPSVVLGTRRVDSAGNVYIYGHNAGASQMNPGCAAVIGSANTSYSFTATNAAAGVGFLAAVCHHSTIPAGSYGWMGVNGLFRAAPDTNAASMNAGDILVIGVDGGFVAGGATLSTGTRWGFAITSMITGYGVNTFTSLGKAWIKSIFG